MKNILVPTDFSINCKKASDLAITMAKLNTAQIHFLHILKTPVDWVHLDKEKESKYPELQIKIGAAKAALRALQIQAEDAGLKCYTFLEFEDGISDVLKHLNYYQNDFIITGSSGAKGFVKEFIGSHVEYIVRKSKVPVIVVKEDAVNFPFRNIVFVSDFKDYMDKAFKEVVAMASFLKAHICLLKINFEINSHEYEADKKQFSLFLEKFPDLKNYSQHVYKAMTVELGIQAFLKNYEVDLIAMGTHGKTGFLRLFSSSIAEGITNHSKLPVMTVHI